MTPILILLTTYFGTIVSKIFFISIVKNTLKVESELTFLSLINPFNFNKIKLVKSLISKYIISILLITLVFFIYSISCITLILSLNIKLYVAAFLYFYLLIIVLFLSYLSIYDLLHYSIPTDTTVYFASFVVVINLGTAILKVLFSDYRKIELGGFNNLMGGLILFVAVYVLIIISKEKAMGKGDADLAGIIGLNLGLLGSIAYIFYTIFIGSILSIILIVLLKKVKGVIIPFVPIMTLGFSITLGFSDILLEVLFISY